MLALALGGVVVLGAHGCAGCGGDTADAGGPDGSLEGSCVYQDRKYGWVACPADGITWCPNYECSPCWCLTSVKLHCLKNDCRLADGGTCCWYDQ